MINLIWPPLSERCCSCHQQDKPSHSPPPRYRQSNPILDLEIDQPQFFICRKSYREYDERMNVKTFKRCRSDDEGQAKHAKRKSLLIRGYKAEVWKYDHVDHISGWRSKRTVGSECRLCVAGRGGAGRGALPLLWAVRSISTLVIPDKYL